VKKSPFYLPSFKESLCGNSNTTLPVQTVDYSSSKTTTAVVDSAAPVLTTDNYYHNNISIYSNVASILRSCIPIEKSFYYILSNQWFSFLRYCLPSFQGAILFI